MENNKCEHEWVFLRKSETYEIGYRKWAFSDFFYCSKCCEEKEVQKPVIERPRYNF